MAYRTGDIKGIFIELIVCSPLEEKSIQKGTADNCHSNTRH
jgi:hypothetical protein